MHANFPAAEQNAEFDAMLRMGVHEALATQDFAAAFASFLTEMPRLAPGFAAQIPPGAERPIALALFREIWNHTPRPDLGWKRLTLPGRNATRPALAAPAKNTSSAAARWRASRLSRLAVSPCSPMCSKRCR